MLNSRIFDVGLTKADYVLAFLGAKCEIHHRKIGGAKHVEESRRRVNRGGLTSREHHWLPGKRVVRKALAVGVRGGGERSEENPRPRNNLAVEKRFADK